MAGVLSGQAPRENKEVYVVKKSVLAGNVVKRVWKWKVKEKEKGS